MGLQTGVGGSERGGGRGEKSPPGCRRPPSSNKGRSGSLSELVAAPWGRPPVCLSPSPPHPLLSQQPLTVWGPLQLLFGSPHVTAGGKDRRPRATSPALPPAKPCQSEAPVTFPTPSPLPCSPTLSLSALLFASLYPSLSLLFFLPQCPWAFFVSFPQHPVFSNTPPLCLPKFSFLSFPWPFLSVLTFGILHLPSLHFPLSLLPHLHPPRCPLLPPSPLLTILPSPMSPTPSVIPPLLSPYPGPPLSVSLPSPTLHGPVPPSPPSQPKPTARSFTSTPPTPPAATSCPRTTPTCCSGPRGNPMLSTPCSTTDSVSARWAKGDGMGSGAG